MHTLLLIGISRNRSDELGEKPKTQSDLSLEGPAWNVTHASNQLIPRPSSALVLQGVYNYCRLFSDLASHTHPFTVLTPSNSYPLHVISSSWSDSFTEVPSEGSKLSNPSPLQKLQEGFQTAPFAFDSSTLTDSIKESIRFSFKTRSSRKLASKSTSVSTQTSKDHKLGDDLSKSQNQEASNVVNGVDIGPGKLIVILPDQHDTPLDSFRKGSMSQTGTPTLDQLTLLASYGIPGFPTQLLSSHLSSSIPNLSSTLIHLPTLVTTELIQIVSDQLKDQPLKNNISYIKHFELVIIKIAPSVSATAASPIIATPALTTDSLSLLSQRIDPSLLFPTLASPPIPTTPTTTAIPLHSTNTRPLIQRSEIKYTNGFEGRLVVSCSRIPIQEFDHFMVTLAQRHLDLQTVQVCDIPMKAHDESRLQKQNFDVNLFFKADYDPVSEEMDNSVEAAEIEMVTGTAPPVSPRISRKRKLRRCVGFHQDNTEDKKSAIRLAWCAVPRQFPKDSLPVTCIHRCTPSQVWSRSAACLVKHVLQDKPTTLVLLNSKGRTSSSSVITHLLVVHGQEMFLHCLKRDLPPLLPYSARPSASPALTISELVGAKPIHSRVLRPRIAGRVGRGRPKVSDGDSEEIETTHSSGPKSDNKMEAYSRHISSSPITNYRVNDFLQLMNHNTLQTHIAPNRSMKSQSIAKSIYRKRLPKTSIPPFTSVTTSNLEIETRDWPLLMSTSLIWDKSFPRLYALLHPILILLRTQPQSQPLPQSQPQSQSQPISSSNSSSTSSSQFPHTKLITQTFEKLAKDTFDMETRLFDKYGRKREAESDSEGEDSKDSKAITEEPTPTRPTPQTRRIDTEKLTKFTTLWLELKRFIRKYIQLSPLHKRISDLIGQTLTWLEQQQKLALEDKSTTHLSSSISTPLSLNPTSIASTISSNAYHTSQQQLSLSSKDEDKTQESILANAWSTLEQWSEMSESQQIRHLQGSTLPARGENSKKISDSTDSTGGSTPSSSSSDGSTQKGKRKAESNTPDRSSQKRNKNRDKQSNKRERKKKFGGHQSDDENQDGKKQSNTEDRYLKNFRAKGSELEVDMEDFDFLPGEEIIEPTMSWLREEKIPSNSLFFQYWKQKASQDCGREISFNGVSATDKILDGHYGPRVMSGQNLGFKYQW